MADFIRSALLATVGVSGLFTLRSGGVSPAPFDSQNFGFELGDLPDNVNRNLTNLIEQAELHGPPHQAMQVHEADTLYCRGAGKVHDQKADILLTDQPNSPLAVRTADCLPVLLADAEAGITVAAHAGWRGSVAQVVVKAVAAMLKYGAQSDRIMASLGPCIGPCCFAIGIEAAQALATSCEGAEQYITEDEQTYADLWAINRLQLLESGLNPAHIELVKQCTCCNPQQFFSFRRDRGLTGRHLGVVTLPTYP